MFGNSVALLGFAALLPIVMLYLVKPKPRSVVIPSLMFIREMEKKESKLNSLLKRFVKDPLLLIQLAVLFFATLAIAEPFYFSKENVEVENIALVLDASASMQATDVAPSRFAKAVELAKSAFSEKDRVSIVVAGNIPIVALKEGSGSEAKAVLSALKPKATPTNLNDAALLAGELLSGKNRRILVFSDFSNADAALAGKIVGAEGIALDFFRVGGEGKNIGIVDLRQFREGYSVLVKSYVNKAEKIGIEIFQNGILAASEERSIQPLSSEVFVLRNISGIASVKLRYSDDLLLDNQVFIAAHSPRKQKILLVSENKTSYLKYALAALKQAELSEAVPPIVPPFSLYDIVIIDKVSKESLLPGTIRELALYVENGGNLIVVASEHLKQLEELHPLLPVEIKESTSVGGVKIETANEITKDIDFEGVAVKYLAASAKNFSITLASAADNPLISLWYKGKGKAAYVGIRHEAEWSNFHLKTSFPIFWSKLVEFMVGGETNENLKTGNFLPTSDGLFLDEVGIYEVKGKKIAVNLLDERESNISVAVLEGLQYKHVFERTTIEVKKEFKNYLLFAALALVVGELLYLRRRGEL
ncbi:MAG: BatA and WFA domain-containing protein [Methanobacteriota archaeon]